MIKKACPEVETCTMRLTVCKHKYFDDCAHLVAVRNRGLSELADRMEDLIETLENLPKKREYSCDGCSGRFILLTASSASFCPYCGLSWLTERGTDEDH